jgi:hypothetical protein
VNVVATPENDPHGAVTVRPNIVAVIAGSVPPPPALLTMHG